MKNISRSLLIGLLAAAGLIGYRYGCKNPDDFKPAEDTLALPPAAPRLLSPTDFYVCLPDAPTCRLPLVWEAVAGAELYEIYFTSDSHGSWTVPYDTNCFTVRLEKEPHQYLIDHFTWRVRCASTRWQYYTDWSEIRHFEVRNRTPAPLPLLPPDDTTMAVDSLPFVVDFDWAPVQDEQFYDFDLFLDSFPEEFRVTDHSFQWAIDDTGTYRWRVRAGSPLWQYPTDWSDAWTLRIVARFR